MAGEPGTWVGEVSSLGGPGLVEKRVWRERPSNQPIESTGAVGTRKAQVFFGPAHPGTAVLTREGYTRAHMGFGTCMASWRPACPHSFAHALLSFVCSSVLAQNVSPIGRNCSQEERDEFEKYDLEAGVR